MRNMLHGRAGRWWSPVIAGVAARPVLSVLVVIALLLGVTGCGKPTTGSRVSISQRAAQALVPQTSFVPAPTIHIARDDRNCSIDRVNYQAAAGMAVDHFGTSIFTGWVGDGVTHAVPPVMALVLVGTTSYWATGQTGDPRPDVAAFNHVPDYAESGFRVHASMYAVPIGEYTVGIMHQVDGKWVRCVTDTRVSVQ